MDDSRFCEAGESLNDHTALMNATVFSCVRVIAESISALPLRLLKVTSAGRSVATDEDLYDLLALAPNDEMSAVNFWEGYLHIPGAPWQQLLADTAQHHW